MPRNFALALLLLALFCALTAHAQPINWDSVRADYITKYQPLIMPKWLFPIIVERNDGMRDTLYLGYHPDANGAFGGADTVYGERVETADTSQLNGSWARHYPGLTRDQVFRVQITPLPTSKAFFGAMELQHDYYLLKVFFDISTLYDTALPFPDTIAPIGLGAIDCYDNDAFNCALHWTPYWLTDDPKGYYNGSHPPCNYTPSTTQGQSPCRATDSIVLYGNSTWGIGVLLFRIMAYMDYATSVSAIESDSELFELFPNPAKELLHLKSSPTAIQQGYSEVRLYHMSGREVYRASITGLPHYNINVQGMPTGIYLLTISNQHTVWRCSVVIQ